MITSSRLAALSRAVLAIVSFAEWIDLDFILPFFFVAADDSLLQQHTHVFHRTGHFVDRNEILLVIERVYDLAMDELQR